MLLLTVTLVELINFLRLRRTEAQINPGGKIGGGNLRQAGTVDFNRPASRAESADNQRHGIKRTRKRNQTVDLPQLRKRRIRHGERSKQELHSVLCLTDIGNRAVVRRSREPERRAENI